MADALNAKFSKRFAGGIAIEGDVVAPASGRSVTVLFGPSGCGKTTILRCLAGLERPEEGRIQFGEETWFDSGTGICVEPQRREIGFVFQDYVLFPHLTVEKNLAYGLRDASGVRDLISRFKVEGLETRMPRTLSGGQQQRVALARALARRPRLLLLDEPLSAADAALREELRGQLAEFLDVCEAPVILVTHDREEALGLGDQIIVMSGGKVLQRGPALEVFQKPADAEVARVVRMENLLAGKVTEVHEGLATVEVGAARMIAVFSEGMSREVIVAVRGEDVAIERRGGGGGSPRNRIAARVTELRPGSPLTRVELDAGFPLFALLTRAGCEALELRRGAEVMAVIKAPAIHLIARRS